MKVFWFLRLKIKWLWKQFFQISSYCKVCGRKIKADFHASNEIWWKIVGKDCVWCFDCFTVKAREMKICTVFDIIPHDDSEFVGEGDCKNHKILNP